MLVDHPDTQVPIWSSSSIMGYNFGWRPFWKLPRGFEDLLYVLLLNYVDNRVIEETLLSEDAAEFREHIPVVILNSHQFIPEKRLDPNRSEKR